MKIDNDRVIFSTGKEVRATRGIIGISPKFCVFEGYDGSIPYNKSIEFENGITKDEALELSEYMIRHWIDFRNKAIEGDIP